MGTCLVDFFFCLFFVSGRFRFYWFDRSFSVHKVNIDKINDISWKFFHFLQGNKMNTERQPLLMDIEVQGRSARPQQNSSDSAIDSKYDESYDGEWVFDDKIRDRNFNIDFLFAGESSSKEIYEQYDPAVHRRVEHPTSNVDTMIHLLKGNIGTGILAMPEAFRNSGLYLGLVGTMFLGFVCTHCMHMLVGCSHELCRRVHVPSMNFPEVCYSAFETGPTGLRRYARLARQIINVFLCITQLGFCCVYFVFVAVNLQEVVAHYYIKLDIRIYLLALLFPMIALNFLKNLKYLTPVSLFASVLTVAGISITFYYMIQDMPSTETVKRSIQWSTLPLYFGTAIYAFEGIGVVLPLENNMQTPEDFGGISGVLNTGMVIVACLYSAVGFFGYLKYGENVKATITLNLDSNAVLAQSVRLIMALAIFLSYGLQFYVPITIIGPWFRNLFTDEHARSISDNVLRMILVIFTCKSNHYFISFEFSLTLFSFFLSAVFLAAIVPNLGPIISLVGALSSSTLALIFPPLIEIITFWPNKMGQYYWVLWKDIAIILFGFCGFFFGSYASIMELINPQPIG